MQRRRDVREKHRSKRTEVKKKVEHLQQPGDKSNEQI